MKKGVWIALIIGVVLALGVGAWFLFGAGIQKGSGDPVNQTKVNGTDERKDLTAEKAVTISIRDLSYSPTNIKIKKGTTVTWVNKDTMGHTITADDAGNPGGLPTEDRTLDNEDTLSVTFNELGTFRYHCEVHSFMHGSVEVVE